MESFAGDDLAGAFGEKSELTPVALEVEGRKLWVNPEDLSKESPVFNNLFFGKSGENERAEEVVVLKGHSI